MIYNKAYCETCFQFQFQLRSCNGIFLPIINEKVENIVEFMKVTLNFIDGVSSDSKENLLNDISFTVK